MIKCHKSIVKVIKYEKGGSGKTTLALNLAACLAKVGDNVLLIDADPVNPQMK